MKLNSKSNQLHAFFTLAKWSYFIVWPNTCFVYVNRSNHKRHFMTKSLLRITKMNIGAKKLRVFFKNSHFCTVFVNKNSDSVSKSVKKRFNGSVMVMKFFIQRENIRIFPLILRWNIFNCYVSVVSCGKKTCLQSIFLNTKNKTQTKKHFDVGTHLY